jgi:hypothetical protein
VHHVRGWQAATPGWPRHPGTCDETMTHSCRHDIRLQNSKIMLGHQHRGEGGHRDSCMQKCAGARMRVEQAAASF